MTSEVHNGRTRRLPLVFAPDCMMGQTEAMRAAGLAVYATHGPLSATAVEILSRSDHLYIASMCFGPKTQATGIARECDIPIWFEGVMGTLADFIATLTDGGA